VIRPAYQPPPVLTALPDNAVSLNVTYGQAIHLLGYRVTQQSSSRASQWRLTPGEEFTVTLFWRSEVPLTDDYSVFVHLVGSDGLIIAQDDSFPAGGAWATSQWPVGAVVADGHQISVPATTYAPDEVALHVGLYRFETGERLPSFPPAAEDSVPILTTRIEPRPGVLPNVTCVNFGNQLTLVGYELEKRVLPARDAIRMTLYWRADRPPDRPYTSFAQVVGESDRIWGQRDTQPMPESGRWEPGQIVRDHKEFQVSQDTPPGMYELRIGVYDSKTHELLGTVPGPGCITMDPVTLTRVRVLPRVR